MVFLFNVAVVVAFCQEPRYFEAWVVPDALKLPSLPLVQLLTMHEYTFPQLLDPATLQTIGQDTHDTLRST